jgi:hypothetical protein
LIADRSDWLRDPEAAFERELAECREEFGWTSATDPALNASPYMWRRLQAQIFKVFVQTDEPGGGLFQFPRRVVPKNNFDFEVVFLEGLYRWHIVAIARD